MRWVFRAPGELTRSPRSDSRVQFSVLPGAPTKEPRAIILAMFDAILFVRIGERAIILKTGELKTFDTELASAS